MSSSTSAGSTNRVREPLQGRIDVSRLMGLLENESTYCRVVAIIALRDFAESGLSNDTLRKHARSAIYEPAAYIPAEMGGVFRVIGQEILPVLEMLKHVAASDDVDYVRRAAQEALTRLIGPPPFGSL